MALNQTDVIIVVTVPIAGCLLLVTLIIVIYCCCCRKSGRENGSMNSPFHKDKKQYGSHVDGTPVHNRDNSMKKRAQSVEYTFYNKAGEVEEVKGYSDDELKPSDQNGHVKGDDTRIYEVNQTGGDVENEVQMRGNAGQQSTESGRSTPEDYLRMSALSASSEASYAVPDVPQENHYMDMKSEKKEDVPDVPQENHYVDMKSEKKEDDDGYIRPNDFGLDDDDDYVNTSKLEVGGDDYINTQNMNFNDDYVNTQNIDIGDDYVNLGETQDVNSNRHGDDGYFKPDPAPPRESGDYAYAELPNMQRDVAIGLSKDQQYVNNKR